MNVRTLCLAILNFEETTGYEIRKLSTEGRYSYFVDASYGSIYPALAKLEEEQLVTSREVSQPGKPSRKVYSITPKGRSEYFAALKIPPQADKFKSEFLLIAMSAPMLDRETVVAAIDAHEINLQSEMDTICQAEREQNFECTNWVASYGRHCLTCSLDYVKKHRADLEATAGHMLEQLDVSNQPDEATPNPSQIEAAE